MPNLGDRDDIDAYVGSRISLRRSAMGLSQTALARQLGISFQQVQKYETGINRISASRLHRVAMILGTSVESFFPAVERERAGDGAILRTLTATADGRAIALDFPMIERVDVRKAVATVVAALAQREADTVMIDR
ncbi:MAG: helix-turn-helix transcriptional regulator [Brevundimonas sp.]|uniref:helix-turn-helix domain-containing protein n=1 Tax=Brevundimonas sp. TaxID=1871086 RepID=UPI001A29769C|nr:helix-turn-helix transcriptional regulator [Brevundimonas sp.]MBJ7447284.1 helix-turn-helix transcriptional regulator [Brevundimonas sp.]